MKTELSIISDDLNHGIIDEKQARTLLLDLLGVSKRFYWLMPDGEISNMWDEENFDYKWTSDLKVVEQLNGKKI